MKKILTILLTTMMLFSFVGCGEKKNDIATEDSKQENETLNVDEGLLTVTINLPNSFFESFETTAEDYVNDLKSDSSEEELFKEVILNDDGSVTIKMSKSKYNELMEKMAKSIDDSIQELIDDNESYPNIKDIKANKDFTQFDVTLASNELSFMDSLIPIAFYMYGGIYQMFKENPNMDIKVNFYGADGGLIDTSTYDQNNNLN